MFEDNKNHKYTSRPLEQEYSGDFYLSAKEIQEKRGEDLARRLHNFRMSLKDSSEKSSYLSSPYKSSLSSDSLENAFLYEFCHLNDIGKKKFVQLIWVKNVQEELSRIWPNFSETVNSSLNKI